MALQVLPPLDGKVQDRDRAGRIFRGEPTHLRLRARASQSGRQFAKPRIMADQSHAFVLTPKPAGAVEKRRETRVVKPGVFFKFGLVLPSSGQDLGRLLRPGGAGMDENIRKKVARGERLGAPPRVCATTPGQLARVVVAPGRELSLGVTNEK